PVRARWRGHVHEAGAVDLRHGHWRWLVSKSRVEAHAGLARAADKRAERGLRPELRARLRARRSGPARGDGTGARASPSARPEVAVDQLDRVPGGVAHVERPGAAPLPLLLLLELDAMLRESLAPGVELALADREGDVGRARRSVRGHDPTRLR